MPPASLLDAPELAAARIDARASGENFPVVSVLAPRFARPHLRAVSGFARLLDTLGDEDVQAGRYGQRLYFWNFAQRRIEQTFDLGADGLVPLEVRFHHDPDSPHGYVGVALSSNVYHWHKNGGGWQLEQQAPAPGHATSSSAMSVSSSCLGNSLSARTRTTLEPSPNLRTSRSR